MPVKTLGLERGVDLVAVPYRLDEGKNVSEDADLKRGSIVMSRIGWRGEQNSSYKGEETFPYQTRFKALSRS